MDLLVVAKEPLPGRAKTRLCPPCRPEEAAAIAEAALADTLAAAVASAADRVLVVLDGAPGRWCPQAVEVVAQGKGSLAERLTDAWRHTEGPALQVGMDTPQVTPAILDDAMARLTGAGPDAVLGLACDGGWWAIGLRRPIAGVFDGIATSRSDTGARQLDRLHSLGLATDLLPRVRDVDTWDDARTVATAVPATAFALAVSAVGDR